MLTVTFESTLKLEFVRLIVYVIVLFGATDVGDAPAEKTIFEIDCASARGEKTATDNAASSMIRKRENTFMLYTVYTAFTCLVPREKYSNPRWSVEN